MFRRRKSKPVPITKVLASVYPSHSTDDLRTIRVFRAWEKAVPERVAANVRPVRVVRDTLHLHASASVWCQEVSLLTSTLVPRLRAVCPDAGVRTLRVRVGPLPPRPEPLRPKPPRRKPVVGALPEVVARALATVQDDALRNALSAAAAVSSDPAPDDPDNNSRG